MKRNQPTQKIDLGKDVLAFDYSETVFLIGRSKDCHIVLDDKQVSREHVRIIHKNGNWFAEKTAEHNDCLHNGNEFLKTQIQDGDSLTISNFVINIENSDSEKIVEQEKLASNIESKNSPVSNEILGESVLENKSQISKKLESEILKDYDATSEIKAPSNKSEDELKVEDNLNTNDELANDDLNVSAENNGDEFNYDDNSEHDAEASLGISSENLSEGVEESAPISESDEMSYSLENIDNSSDEDSTKVMKSFSKVLLELFGETAPYDKFLIEDDKTYIGRDPAKCQIVLNDSEVSTVHAVIVRNNIMITLEDLNSSNGTILNGDRINKATLSHNDEFVIGGVTFTIKFRSDFLKEENSTLMAVDENQTVEIEEVVEVEAQEGESVDALGQMIDNAPLEKSFIKRIWKDEAKRKKAIYGAVVLIGAWVFLGDDGANKPPAPVKTAKKSSQKTETSVNKNTGKKLSDDEHRALAAIYEIGKNHYYNARYREALEEFQKVTAVDPSFNSSLQSLIALSKEGLSKIEEQEKKRLAEIAAAEKKLKVKELVLKVTDYVKEHKVELANDVFNEIAKLDPENLEVTRLKMELEDWQKEKARKELEEASKKKIREDKVEKLKPGKTLFLQKEWYKAVGKLDDFMKIKDMDEDLTKEASEMLKTSRNEVSSAVAPLVGKAKSLMEGQDLKGAYEIYLQILKIEPSNTEALNATGEIKDQLSNKARKIYREAIISESLSLFQDAKEKFQEVQQVSPVDSEYYKKASDKLKDYLE